MADYNNLDGRRYKRHMVDQPYVVDTGRVFHNHLYQGNNKPERPMLVKLLIYLWYGVGLPCWLWSVCIYLFGWFHITDPKEFVTLLVSVILGVTKAAIMWAEKGDIVWDKIKRLFTKPKLKKKRTR